MKSASIILALIFLAAVPSAAQAPWPGQPANPVGYAAAPGWTGSFNATACPAQSSGSSWATAVIISNCTYTSASLTLSCNFCEFLQVDFKGTASNGNWNLSGSNQLFLGDRFQSNETGANNVSILGDHIYLFYDSFVPLTSLTASPPGSLWPSAGAGTNSTTMTSGVNDTPAANGYQFSITPQNSSGPLWIDHCDMWGFANSVDLLTTTAQITFTNNWVHDARDPVAFTDHTDGVGYLNGATAPNNVLVAGNTIATLGTTQDLALQAATGGYQNIYINENFLSGDGATVAFCQPGSVQCTNSTLYGNVYGTDIPPGTGGSIGNPIYNAGSALGSGSQWDCNTISVRAGTTWTSSGGWTPLSSMNGQFFLNSNIPNSTTDQGGNTTCAIPSPASANFGIQSIGMSSSAKAITLKNTNSATLSISSIALASGTQFSILSNTCGSTLAASASCTINVQFSPTSLGPQTDTLQITDNTPGVTSPQLVPLSGVGGVATIMVRHVGGPATVPPWLVTPITANELLNPNMELCTGASGCGTGAGQNLILQNWSSTNCPIVADNTHNYNSGGTWSMKVAVGCSSTSAAGTITQNFTYQGGEKQNVLIHYYTDANFVGSFNVNFKDGGVFPGAVAARSGPEIVTSANGDFTTPAPNSQGWVSATREVLTNGVMLHRGDTYTFQIVFTSGVPTKGNIWFDAIVLTEQDYAVYNLVTWPNFDGWLWSDLVPDSVHCGTSPTPFAGEVCGRVELSDPWDSGAGALLPLSSITYTVSEGTAVNCVGGTTIATGNPSAGMFDAAKNLYIFAYTFDASALPSESSLPVTPYRICLKVVDTYSSGAVTTQFADEFFYKGNATLRATLTNWIGVRNELNRLGSGTEAPLLYEALTSNNNLPRTSSGSAVTAAWSNSTAPTGVCGLATADLCWAQMVTCEGIDPPLASVPPGGSGPPHTNMTLTNVGSQCVESYHKEQIGTVEDISDWITLNPLPGVNDSMGPVGEALQDNGGIGMGILMNVYYCTLWTGICGIVSGDVPPGPVSVVPSTTGGNLRDNGTHYLWIKLTPHTWNTAGQGGARPLQATASQPVVSSALLSNSTTGSAVVTMPTGLAAQGDCVNERHDGWVLTQARSTSNTVPPPPENFWPVMDDNNTPWVPCGQTTATIIGSPGDGADLALSGLTPATDTAVPTFAFSNCTANCGIPSTNHGGPTVNVQIQATETGTGNFSQPSATVQFYSGSGLLTSTGTTTQSAVSGAQNQFCAGTGAEAAFAGEAIVINGTTYTISSITCPGTLVTTTPVTAGVNLPWAISPTITMPAASGSFSGWYSDEATTSARNPWNYFVQQTIGSPTAPGGTWVVPSQFNFSQQVLAPTDFTNTGRAAGWMAGLSDPQIWADFGTLATTGDSLFPKAAQSFVHRESLDEANPAAAAPAFYQTISASGIQSVNPGIENFCITVDPSALRILQQGCDVATIDPYPFGTVSGADLRAIGGYNRNGLVYYASGNLVQLTNGVAQAAAFLTPQLEDIEMNAQNRIQYGSKRRRTVIQDFQKVVGSGSNTIHGYPYSELRREMWKVIIDTKASGSNMPCPSWWVQNNGQGIDQWYWAYNNPQAYSDLQQTIADCMALSNLLLAPTLDSTEPTSLPGYFPPGMGTFLTAVTTSQTAAQACFPVGATPGTYSYTNATYYPTAPIEAFAGQDSVTNIYYVLSNDLCGSANNHATGGNSFYTIFTKNNSVATPAVISVVGESRTILMGNTANCPGATLTSNQWCDGPAAGPVTAMGGAAPYTDQDIHIYAFDGGVNITPPPGAVTFFAKMLTAELLEVGP